MIIGHKDNIQYLINLVNNKNLSHSYLFYGPNHIGKRLVAIYLANYLENKSFDEPKKIFSDFLEIDTKNKIENEESILDEIRNIRNFLYQKPTLSSYRMVLINNAEKLSVQSQNALLKISEEPTEFSLIILICRDPEFLLPTINSRFQKIYFRPVPTKEIQRWLIDEFGLKTEEAYKLAEFSGGLPGIAKLYLKDEIFRKYLKNAQKFLNLKGDLRLNFIKKFIDEELSINGKFDPDFYLEILMILLNYSKNRNKNLKLFKKVLKMRMDFDFYNLNPKLHFIGLAHFLNSL